MNCPGHTQFRYQIVFFVHIYGYIWLAEGCLWHLFAFYNVNVRYHLHHFKTLWNDDDIMDIFFVFETLPLLMLSCMVADIYVQITDQI